MRAKHILLMTTIATCLMSLPGYAADEKSSPASTAKPAAERPFIPKEQWDKLPLEEKNKIKAERRAAWDAKSPEEKEKIRAERREKWEKMSPEEKEARRKEMHNRYEKASPEQKERIRERIKERHARMEEKMKTMSPEEKEKFLKDHPHMADRMQHRDHMEMDTKKEPERK